MYSLDNQNRILSIGQAIRVCFFRDEGQLITLETVKKSVGKVVYSTVTVLWPSV